MNRLRVLFFILLSLPATALTTTEIDLSDFDNDTMRDMDDAIKALDSNIALQDATAAIADIETLRAGLAWAETYFIGKNGAPDAVQFAQQGRTLTEAVAQSIAAKDFDAAFVSYRSLVKNCRSCHDAYKDPSF